MKVLFYILASTLIAQSLATVQLTKDDFEAQTQGKKAFVAFKAPWCAHCKKLAPEWDKLAENVEILVGEVDCTVEKELCAEHGVQGYPTIKYSDGYSWNKYEKQRSYDALEKFVEDELQLSCFDDENLCSEDEKNKIEEATSLSGEEVKSKLDEIKAEKEKEEVYFQNEVKKLQSAYEKLQNKKSDRLKELQTDESYLKYALSVKKEEL